MTETITAADYRKTEPESSFQNSIVDAAKRLGWVPYAWPDSRRTEPGHPDLVLVNHDHPERDIIYLECKTMTGAIRPEQQRFIDTAQAAGRKAYIVRPCHMDFVISLLDGTATAPVRGREES